MLTQISSLIGRDFIVGYFVPSVCFVVVTKWILSLFGIAPTWLDINPADPLKDTTFLALITALIAFILMALNRFIFRILEGYWWIGQKTLGYFERRRFRNMKTRIEELETEKTPYDNQHAHFPKLAQLNRLRWEFANSFPSKESLVLPTKFGNAVRAFEDYPRVVYRIESIQGWFRLCGVIPKDFNELINSTRATTDLWVNAWALSLFVIIEYLVLAATNSWRFPNPWIPVVALAAAFGATVLARHAAQQWGECVKAAFDLYLPDLAKQLGYQRPVNPADQEILWRKFSDVLLYRDSEPLLEITNWRTPTSSENPTPPAEQQTQNTPAKAATAGQATPPLPPTNPQ